MINEATYLLPAIVGGSAIALLGGPFGAMMVWRRFSYLGDTISHSGLLGVTLAIILNINLTIGICAIALMVALLVFRLQSNIQMSADTALGLLSHTLLALGLLLLSLFEFIRVDILGFLYGDILAIAWDDVAVIIGGGVVMLGLLACIWPSLMRITLQAELASVEGVPVARIQALFLALLAIVIAMAMKMVGVLLITALLIIPAASGRFFAKSPIQMVFQASGLGVLAVWLGIALSHFTDLPTGPAIVVIAALQFVCLWVLKKSLG